MSKPKTKEPIPSPEELLQSESSDQELEDDIRRHREMRGYPPEGPIFQMRSEPEIAQRIARLKKGGSGLRG